MHRRHFLRLVASSAAAAAASPLLPASTTPVIVNRVQLLRRRVVTLVSIGGRPGLPFAIDTGGFVSLIDNGLARSLRLRERGTTRVAGIGGTAQLPLYLANDVVFGGGIRQPEAVFAGMADGFSGEIRGALAAGVLTTLDSDLDLEAGEWRVYPQGRSDRAGFVRMENGIIESNGGSPRLFGEASVNGRRLRFLIDTGAPGALSLHEPAAKALGLWEGSRPYSPQRTRGVGGRGGLGRLIRADNVEFGGRRFDRPIILLRQDGGSHDVDGIIGLDLLRGFNLSTEVRNRSLWVQAHAAAKPLSNDYNRAGLWLEERGRRTLVSDVGTGSPAANAGIKVGDELIGEPFPDLIRQIDQPAGTSLSLEVAREGARRSVRLTLTDYL